MSVRWCYVGVRDGIDGINAAPRGCFGNLRVIEALVTCPGLLHLSSYCGITKQPSNPHQRILETVFPSSALPQLRILRLSTDREIKSS